MAQFSAILPNFSGLIISTGWLRLRLLTALGSGAYGVVYLAHDLASSPKDPVHYAVKCLLKHPEGSEHHNLQQREIAYHKAASHHDHVVKLHHVIEEDHYLYLVLDHCPGGDLFSAIIDRGVYMHNNACLKRSFLQLLDAVHSCHDLGIYHRDLKPENILCSKDTDRVYLSDFGLATRAKLSANFGCGSSFYMSPECIGSASHTRPFVTSVSDIWSLGVILVNLITGRNPWHVASPSDDPGFANYLLEGESYLRRMLPMSRSASILLARVFVMKPEQRITLNEFRSAIHEIDTFFPDPTDNFAKPVPPPTIAVGSVDITDCSHAQLPGWGDPKVVAIRPLPSPISFTDSTVAVRDDSSSRHVFPPSPHATSSTLAGSSHSLFSDESSSDSAGPVTPETHAINVSTSIPELALEFPRVPSTFDVEGGLSERDIASSRCSLGMKKRKLPISWERFVQRIKVRG